MNPPKCPACGHEHWAIEGCGPAEVVTEDALTGLAEADHAQCQRWNDRQAELAAASGLSPEAQAEYRLISRMIPSPPFPTGLAAVGPTVYMTEDGLYSDGELVSQPVQGIAGPNDALMLDRLTLQAAESAVLLRIRKGLGLSQPKFGEAFDVALGTLRGWESGRHKMPSYFMTLLRVIEAEPEAVFRALGRKE